MPKLYEFNDFIKSVYGTDKSVFTCVLGSNGTGKTDFNLLQLERIHELGLGARFGSNMPIPEALQPSFEMDFIEDLETLEKTCRLLNPDPKKRGIKKYFFFLSELGKFIPRDEAWRKENREFIQKLQIVRKFGLNMISDAIDRVDARVLHPSFFDGVFHKPFPETPSYAQYQDLKNGQKMIFRDIPKCDMWFDTYYTANFYLTPQDNNKTNIELDQSEQIVKKYLETGSWKSSGITTQQGKRELFKILKRYYAIRQPSDQEPVKEKPVSESVSTE